MKSDLILVKEIIERNRNKKMFMDAVYNLVTSDYLTVKEVALILEEHTGLFYSAQSVNKLLLLLNFQTKCKNRSCQNVYKLTDKATCQSLGKAINYGSKQGVRWHPNIIDILLSEIDVSL